MLLERLENQRIAFTDIERRQLAITLVMFWVAFHCSEASS